MMNNNAWSVNIPFLQKDGMANTPNTRTRSKDEGLRDYFEAMYVTFASIRRANPNLELSLISNRHLPKKFADLHAEIGVHTQIVPFTRTTIDSKAGNFLASLYYLDVLGLPLAKNRILLDPDILCTQPLDFINNLPLDRLGGMTINYNPDRQVNGLSLAQASVIHKELGTLRGSLSYYGGELYAIPGDMADDVRWHVERAWKLRESKVNTSEPHFHTEEHIMNYVYASLPASNLNTHVKRIWTTHRYRNVDGMEHNVPLWHLPAEKGRGFHILYEKAVNPDSWFWRVGQKEFIKRSAYIMGMRNRNPIRWSIDHVGSQLHALQKNR